MGHYNAKSTFASQQPPLLTQNPSLSCKEQETPQHSYFLSGGSLGNDVQEVQYFTCALTRVWQVSTFVTFRIWKIHTEMAHHRKLQTAGHITSTAATGSPWLQDKLLEEIDVHHSPSMGYFEYWEGIFSSTFWDFHPSKSWPVTFQLLQSVSDSTENSCHLLMGSYLIWKCSSSSRNIHIKLKETQHPQAKSTSDQVDFNMSDGQAWVL